MSLDPSSDVSPSASGHALSTEAEQARLLVAQELAALGEIEASADELDLVLPRVGELSASEDQRLVGEMFRIAEAMEEGEAELDELAQRRVWAVVDGARASTEVGGSGKYWAGFALASAAAILLFVSRPGMGTETNTGNADLAAAAHAGLSALGVDTSPGVDARRTKALADFLERRLGEQG